MSELLWEKRGGIELGKSWKNRTNLRIRKDEEGHSIAREYHLRYKEVE
jgi:hypothetical protein